MIGRTRWQTLVAVAAGTAAVSYIASSWWLARGNAPLPIPSSLAFVLLGVAVVLFLLGRSVRRFTQGKRRMDPLHAFRILVLAKASALAGSAQLGFFVAQVLVVADLLEAPVARAAARASAAAAFGCLVLVIVALVVEWFCRVPPVDGERPEQGAQV